MTKKLEQLEAALAAASAGEWDFVVADNAEAPHSIVVDADGEELLAHRFGVSDKAQNDVQFIALAHNLMPDLLEAVKVLRAVTGTYRTFRDVPQDEQAWTSIDDDALESAFAVLAKLESGEKKMKCFFCLDNGYEVPATRVMPQSADEEKTVEMFACCDGHVAGWWDEADWDGSHLEIPLDNQPNAVIFHDRGAGKEFRLFIDGKIILRENADNEVLGSELSEAVEHLIAKGQFSGVTTDSCYPEWTLAYIAP